MEIYLGEIHAQMENISGVLLRSAHFSLCSGSKAKASLHEVHVDFLANVHAVLELVLVIALGSLSLNVLLNSINL